MAAGQDGTLWAWATLGGEIALTRRELGAEDWTTPAVVQTAAGVDLAVRDIPSSFARAWEGPARLILATIQAASVGPSDWWSADAGATVQSFGS
jgi:hypothetical protein